MRYLKWIGLAAGVGFGYFGWGLMHNPATEVPGMLLFFYPALALSALLHITATDETSQILTASLYGIVLFLLGLAVEWVHRRLTRSRGRGKPA